jgi:hypothetical protein
VCKQASSIDQDFRLQTKHIQYVATPAGVQTQRLSTRPSTVRFPFKAPANVTPYCLAFGVSPTFDSDCSALVFPLSVLDRPLAAADPLLHRLMEERVRELEQLSKADLVSGLRRILRTLVPAAARVIRTLDFGPERWAIGAG